MIRFVIGLILCLSTVAFGQQTPQYSQYIRNQYVINPAAVGVSDYTNITLGGRWQWAGLDDAPKTSYLYYSSPVNQKKTRRINRTFGVIKRNKKAVRHPRIRTGRKAHTYGANFVADQYGPFRQLKIMGTYAYHLPLNREYNLSFGVSGGLANRTFLNDKAQVLSVLTNTGVYDQTYASYTAGDGAQNTLELESGIYFYGEDVFLGVSAGQLTKDLVKFGNREFNVDPRIHWFFTGGYTFQMSRTMTVTPAFLIKYVKPAPVSWEISAQFDYRERFWFGTSYRHRDAIVLGIGGYISNQWRIGYSYDATISKLNKYGRGGHELMIGIMIGREN